jgi:quaternary ammonium compound-resistance protein SugE
MLPMVCRFVMASRLIAPTRASSERKFMPWLWLIIGGCFEVGFTTSLRFVDGFRNVPWTIAFLISVAISMGLLEVASRSIPMGTAYAVWGGIGAVGTVLVGILWFHEPSSTVRILLILAIVAAIAALRLTA